MRRILLVKTSSLGDVVHNLPVATDLRAHNAGVEIDWAVEENFADIPALHPAISEVITVAPRRWRRTMLNRNTWREIAALRARLKGRAYDLVIDTQGLIKSALIARMAPGRRFGKDWGSSREPLWPFFHRTIRVSWELHAVERNRQLAALALGYTTTAACDYGIAPPSEPLGEWAAQWAPSRCAVLLHATSARAKLWPEHYWVKLASHLHRGGLHAVLPWGSEAERRRGEHIAALVGAATVPPRLSLREAAGLLGRARVVFGVDTGLTHLSAALGTPTIGIYCATDPAATGLYGVANAVSVGGRDGPPDVAAVTSAWRRLQPAIDAALQP
jgi:lipopolysaccharide heptosyltransferase I